MRIRRAQVADADGVAAIYTPIVRDTPISFEVEPPGREELARRISAIGADRPWLVGDADGRVLGYAYATSHRERAAYRWCVDVSVYVAGDARRRGLAAALYAALLETLVLQGFHRAYAGITLPNAASVGLHESLGFQPVGVYREVGWKCGAWHDVGWWERGLGSAEGAPAEPVSLASLDPARLEPLWQRAAQRVR